MTAVHTDTTHDCSDDYCVGIDSQGNYRMSGGRGRLVANHDHTINDVRGWFERSKPGQYREDYRAVLRFMRREAGVPDAAPVHRDEEHDYVPPKCGHRTVTRHKDGGWICTDEPSCHVRFDRITDEQQHVVDVDTAYESDGYAKSAGLFVNDISAWTPPDRPEPHRRSIGAHQMRVLRDDGIYRHLRFQSPDTGIAWFELVTWPGALTICGDMGSFTFRRLDDMFEFFGGKPDINPHYWMEKLVDDANAKAYDVELAKQMIREHAAEWEPERAGRPVETIHSPLLGDVLDEDEADEAAADLKAEIDELIEELVDDESHDRMLIDGFLAHGHEFVDTFEWDLKGYTHRYLWCCHAIRWGIREFRAWKAATDA